MRKSTQNKLIAVSDEAAPPQVIDPSTVPAFSQNMLHYPNAKDAAQIISEQAALEFTLEHDGALEKANLLQTELDKQFAASLKTLESLEANLKNTKQFIKASFIDGEDIKTFWQWKPYDQLSMAFLVVALVAAMVMAAANVYSNIMASGQQVFLDNPSLAVFMSLLMPAGSTAIKFFTHFMDFQSTRKRYALLIYSLTALALLVWMVYFAIQFPGISAGFDWDSVGETNTHAGSIQVFTTLIAELLVAASLFLAAEDIYLKYSPNAYTESLEYLNAKKARDTHLVSHEKLNTKRGDNHAHIVQQDAARQSHINQRLAEFTALRARISKLNQY